MSTTFVSPSPLPNIARSPNFQKPRIIHASIPHPSSFSRRRLLSTVLAVPVTTFISKPSYASPVETHHVFIDLSVAGSPAGRIVIALYRQEAPTSVDTFLNLINGTLRSRAGKTLGFKYSQATKVVPGKRLQLGHIKQIDALNQQPGTPQRQLLPVQVPENHDDNQLRHDAPGLVSVRRGGSFEFWLTIQPDQAMDEQNLVVGHITQGMQVVERLGKVPTNKKTIRDAYRSIGKLIGDARAKVDLEDKVRAHKSEANPSLPIENHPPHGASPCTVLS